MAKTTPCCMLRTEPTTRAVRAHAGRFESTGALRQRTSNGTLFSSSPAVPTVSNECEPKVNPVTIGTPGQNLSLDFVYTTLRSSLARTFVHSLTE
eukprot:4057388-Prymnesium_polylepis.1